LTLLVALTLAGCGDGEIAVPEPDLAEMEPQVAELLDSARRAVVARRGSAEAWGELGTAYDAHGLFEEAERCYREAHRLDPERLDWIYLLAIVREMSGAEVDEVVELFARAAELRPDYPPIAVRLAAALAIRGENQRAHEAYERAVRLAPDAAVAHRGLGQVLLALGEIDGAIAELTRAVELEPRDLSVHSALAQAYMRQGSSEQAQAILERASGLQPIDAVEDRLYGERVFMRGIGSSRAFTRAQAAMRIGRWDQAVRDLELVLRARPDFPSAHYWKGVAHRQMGQTGPALAHLSRAVELEPSLVAARLELGALLLAAGRHAEAVEQYERAAALRPLDPDSQRALDRAREAQR
jgi:tetratricopeptide (TPR) repeat protein